MLEHAFLSSTRFCRYVMGMDKVELPSRRCVGAAEQMLSCASLVSGQEPSPKKPRPEAKPGPIAADFWLVRKKSRISRRPMVTSQVHAVCSVDVACERLLCQIGMWTHVCLNH